MSNRFWFTSLRQTHALQANSTLFFINPIIMQKKLVHHYKLKGAIIPMIKGESILHDPGIGGEKLVYKIFKYRVYTRFNIPGLNYFLERKAKQKIFLRPFKKYWDSERNRLPYADWGKKESPLTNLWLEIKKDYTKSQFKAQLPEAKDVVKDPELKKYLRKHAEEFKLFYQI
jgi:hypothetical protein